MSTKDSYSRFTFGQWSAMTLDQWDSFLLDPDSSSWHLHGVDVFEGGSTYGDVFVAGAILQQTFKAGTKSTDVQGVS